jgi:hypothetical protein
VAKGHGEPQETLRQLVIVARSRGKLYEYLRRAFAGNETVRVIVSRRVAERRLVYGPYDPDRRGRDRRAPLQIDGLLREIGFAVVRQDAAESHRGDQD